MLGATANGLGGMLHRVAFNGMNGQSVAETDRLQMLSCFFN
jgi:hypothetical protein